MTIVVTGASGLLGRQVFAVLSKKYSRDLIGCAYSRSSSKLQKIDLLKANETTEFLKSKRPHIVIHCAAERRPDVCNNNHDYTLKMNVDSVRLLAKLAIELDYLLIYISTDYVFDGTNPPYIESSTPNPLQFYGKTKLDGELAIKEIMQSPKNTGSYCILRVPVLYGEVEFNGESAINSLVDIVNVNIKGNSGKQAKFSR